jgi:hypothetical protein
MIDGCLCYLSQGVDGVIYVTLAQQEGSECTLESLDPMVDIKGLKTVESEAQEDCCGLQSCIQTS